MKEKNKRINNYSKKRIIKIIIKKTILILFAVLSSTFLVASNYYANKFSGQEFDEILYYLKTGIENTSDSVIQTIFSDCIGTICMLSVVLIILFDSGITHKWIMNIRYKTKYLIIQLYPIKIINRFKVIIMPVILIVSVSSFLGCFGVFTYLKNKFQDTNIFDEYYVNGSEVKITFPKEKRNLIVIFCESMENSMVSKKNGGAWEESLIPELEQIALDNINFSNTDKIGGAQKNIGSTFTVAGLVSETSGVPLLIPAMFNDADENVYVGDGSYLENVYALGDVLKENGYNLEMMMGSYGSYGGRQQYFQSNGGYEIFDVEYAMNNGFMTKEDFVFWGFSDDKLFEWSKEEIMKLANRDEPFNYMMLTVDTHFWDGYLSEKAPQNYPTQYENVYAYSSYSINEFVEWIKKQDFYENTTIVILGDHLGMNTNFYESRIGDQPYVRTIYNAFINSAIEPEKEKCRQFNSMDIYPTMLASIGVEIDGNRIGIGTNLFSEEQTLAEELGIDYIDSELRKNSHYYNKYILGNHYYVMRDAADEAVEKKHKEDEKAKAETENQKNEVVNP